MRHIMLRFRNFAHQPGDSPDASFKKLLILLIALSGCTCGLIWSATYYTVFGFGLTMMLPLSFVVIVGIMIFISDRMADHRPLILVQLFCITWISALIQWSIGSMDHSGLVIAWGFLGPLGALFFLSTRQALIWMAMFLSIVIISAVFEPAISGYPLVVSDQARVLFYLMNLGASAIMVFAASTWLVNTIKFERSRAERLLQKICVLFGQHVSEEAANELIVRDLDAPGGKAYQATIMFLDIRDFTAFADSRAPQEVAAFQNVVFNELINIVRANKGIVHQILGDGIVAVFGAPVTNDTHVMDAVNSGYAMITKTKELSDRGKILPIRIGIGLHTGKIIAGEVGNEYRKLYSLAGSNVIIASRIEQLNKELQTQFLVSEAVYNKVKDSVHPIIYMGKKALKGISDPVGIYQLG